MKLKDLLLLIRLYHNIRILTILHDIRFFQQEILHIVHSLRKIYGTLECSKKKASKWSETGQKRKSDTQLCSNLVFFIHNQRFFRTVLPFNAQADI